VAPVLESSALAVDCLMHRGERVRPEPAERHDLVASRHDVDRVELGRAQKVQDINRGEQAFVAEGLSAQRKGASLLEREAKSHGGRHPG
jgi:hypothetical protein